MKIEFVGNTDKELASKQIGFVKAAIKDGMVKGDVTIDNTKVVIGKKAVICFIDLTSGACGFGRVVPSEFAHILLGFHQKMKTRVKVHWYLAFEGDQLPNRNWPFPLKGGPW